MTGSSHDTQKQRGVVAYGGLAVCTVCMCAAAQLIQLSKRATGSYHYSYYALNVLVEGAKLAFSVTALVLERRSGGVGGFFAAFRELPQGTLYRYAIPAGIYVINNNLYYVILFYMDAATFQVVMSLKIVATGLLMYFVLGKRISGAQWLALLVLTVGSVVVQVERQHVAAAAAEAAGSAATAAVARRASVTGFAIACVYCTVSGFAGVATEALLKGAKRTSIHACNVLLYGYGLAFNLAAFWVMEPGDTPFLRGVTGLTWVIVANSAVMGMIISAIMKHFDNIVKVYLNSVAIVLSVAVSMATVNFRPSVWFAVSVLLVSMSAVAYSRNSWEPLRSMLLPVRTATGSSRGAGGRVPKGGLEQGGIAGHTAGRGHAE